MKLSELIRNTQDRPLIPVPTPEWGEADGQIFVRKLSPKEKHEFWESRDACRIADWNDFVPFVVVTCSFDKDGIRVFSADDREWLASEKSAVPVDRLFTAIDDLNIFSVRAEEEAKKNLGQPANSGSI